MRAQYASTDTTQHLQASLSALQKDLAAARAAATKQRTAAEGASTARKQAAENAEAAAMRAAELAAMEGRVQELRAALAAAAGKERQWKVREV